MATKKPNPPTTFSHQHYHELSADETEAREQGFSSIGSPTEGPSSREAEQEAEPSGPPHPHLHVEHESHTQEGPTPPAKP